MTNDSVVRNVSYMRRASEGNNDELTNAFSVVEVNKVLINKSKFFTANFLKLALAKNASYYISFTTPETKQIHSKPVVISAKCEILKTEIFEDSTVTGGDAVDILQHNRTNIIDSACVVKSEPTISDAGNLIVQNHILGYNQTQKGSIANFDSTEKIILKPSTTYVIKITNLGETATTDFTVNLSWFEL